MGSAGRLVTARVGASPSADPPLPRGRSASHFHASVARIHAGVGGGEQVAGAGFLVGPELLVTCAHVLGDATGREPVRVTFPQAENAPEAWGELVRDAWRPADAEDVAFLRLRPAPTGVPVLGLRSAPGAPGRDVRAFGFPTQAPGDGHPGTARIGETFRADGVPLLALTEANALARGFSGSPVVDDDGLVVAMITSHPGRDLYGRGVDLAYATPASVLQRLGPGLGVVEECPYPGLVPFSADQAEWFHGRASSVEALVSLLRTERGVLALLGASGSGKSSLVAAGLFRAVADGHLPGLRADPSATLRPSSDLPALAERLAPAGDEPELVVIDQFEELLIRPPEVAVSDLVDQVLSSLVRIAEGDGPCRVLLVLRDDFYPHLSRRSPSLMDHLLRGRIVNLTDGLRSEDLASIIIEPARTQGWNVSPLLTDRLIRDLVDQRTLRAPLSTLPLLALTLRRIWETATAGDGTLDNTLTSTHYDVVGGVRTAFPAWCDRAFRSLGDDDRDAAKLVVTALVRDGDPARGIVAVRRRRTRAELTELAGERADGVLDYLARERIVTATRDPGTGDVVFELAHDTLIQHWTALQIWLEADREHRRWAERTEERAREWAAAPRPRAAGPWPARVRGRLRDELGSGALSGLLLQDEQLAEAVRRRNDGRVPDVVARYIDASALGASRRQRARRGAVVLVSLLALSLIGSLFTVARQNRLAAEEARFAELIARAERDQIRDPAAAAAALIGADEVRPGRAEVRDLARQLVASPGRSMTVLHDVRTEGAPGLSAGRRLVVSFAADGTVVLDTATGRQVKALPASSAAVLRPDDRVIAMIDGDSFVFWDLTQTPPTRLGGVYGSGLAYSSDGRLASTLNGSGVTLWDVHDPSHPVQRAGWFTGDTAISAAQPLADGSVVTLSASGGLQHWTSRRATAVVQAAPAQTAQQTAQGALPSWILRVDPTGRQAFVARTATVAAVASLVDLQTHQVRSILSPPSPSSTGGLYASSVWTAGFSADGSRLVTSDLAGTGTVYDTRTGQRIAELRGHTSFVTRIAFLGDSASEAVTAALDGTVRLWDLGSPGAAFDPAHPTSSLCHDFAAMVSPATWSSIDGTDHPRCGERVPDPAPPELVVPGGRALGDPQPFSPRSAVADDLLVTHRKDLLTSWKVPTGTARAVLSGRVYRMDVDQPVTGGQTVWSPLAAPRADHFFLSAQVASSGGTTGACGLLIGSATRSWAVVIRRDNGAGVVNRFTPASSVTYFATPPPTGPRLLAIGVAGGVVQAFVDGVLVGTVNDASLTKSTRIGVAANGGKVTCSFRSLTVQDVAGRPGAA